MLRFFDLSIARSFWSQIVFLFILVGVAFGVLGVVMRSVDRRFCEPGVVEKSGIAKEEVCLGTPEEHQYALCDFWADAWGEFSGSVDMKTKLKGWDFFAALCLRTIGAIFLIGILVSTITNMLDRRVELWNKGLIRYPKSLRNHYLIIGEGEEIVKLVHNIFKGKVAEVIARNKIEAGGSSKKYGGEPILIATHGDVGLLRERIFSALPTAPDREGEDAENPKPGFRKWLRNLRKRKIIFYYSDLSGADSLNALKPENAQVIFVLGDVGEKYGRDVRNLSCVVNLNRVIEAKIAKGKIDPNVSSKPLFVQFDGVATHDIAMKLDVLTGNGNKKKPLHFSPRAFNLYENWARLLWGFYGWRNEDVSGKLEPKEDYFYRSLDYSPIREASDKSHVHLMIVGFSQMGQALTLEALRICHYANFNEATGANKTKITIIDPEGEKLKAAFLAQYPNLSQVYDIDLEFLAEPVESEIVRERMEACAHDKHCLLTIAVCLSDPEIALTVGLNLPDAVYEEVPSSGKAGNSVLIRQAIYGEIFHIINDDNCRYKHVKAFGCWGYEFDGNLLCERIPKMVNWAYKKELKKIYGELMELRKQEKDKIEENWWKNAEYLRWSNRFQVDSYRVFLNVIGLTAVEGGPDEWKGKAEADAIYKMIEAKAEIFKDMEHRRWIAERTLAGEKAWEPDKPVVMRRNGEGELELRRDKTRRLHACLRPTGKIKPEVLNGESVGEEVLQGSLGAILNMPYLLRLENYRFKGLENFNNEQ